MDQAYFDAMHPLPFAVPQPIPNYDLIGIPLGPDLGSTHPAQPLRFKVDARSPLLQSAYLHADTNFDHRIFMLLVPGFGFFLQMDYQLEEAFLAPHADFRDLTCAFPKLLHPDEDSASPASGNNPNTGRLFIADSMEGSTATGFIYIAKSDAHLNKFRTDQGFCLEDNAVAYEYNHGKNRAGKDRITSYIVGTGMDALVSYPHQ